MKRLEQITIKEMTEVLANYDMILVDGGVMPKFHGFCDHDRRKIYINNSGTESSIKRTIFHEISHAYHYMNGMKDSETNTKRVERNTWKKYNGRS